MADLALQARVLWLRRARQVAECVRGRMRLGEASAREGGAGRFVDKAIRRAHRHGKGRGPTCCFVQVDVLEVRQVLGCAHEVQQC
jgi:hypothetical protein